MQVMKTRNVKTPTRGTSLSAGLDFYVPNDFFGGDDAHSRYAASFVSLDPGDSILIPSGIKVKVPAGYALIAFNKSGVASRKNLSVGACVVDEDYTGEIHLHVFNHGNTVQTIGAGEKLIQFLLIPVSYAEITVVQSEQELYDSFDSERGEGGFGSTGNGVSDYTHIEELNQTDPSAEI